MPVLYANNAASRLAASITNVAISFSVTAGHGARFPVITGGDHFYATLMDSAGNLEVVRVTARATDTFTVQRAQEGTTARAYAVNDIVELRITRAMLDDLKTDTRAALTSGNVTTALGFTPYNATNPSGFITSVGTAANVSGTVAVANGGTGATTAGLALANLGGYAATNPSAFINQAGARTALSFTAGSGAYNSTTGVITIPTNTNQLTNGAGFTGNTGTVTSVGGTGTVSGLTLTGTVTGSGNLTLGGTLNVTPSNFASQTARTFLAAPNAAAGVPTFRTILASDVPTLNQNTTGNAATATTATNVSGGTASVTTLAVNSNNISAVNSLGFRNRIMNGDMEINQRNAGAVLVNTSNNGVKTIDRWFCAANGPSLTFQQVVDGPTTGPKYSLKITTTTAWTGTGQEGNHIFQWIENSNVLDFKYGTAQANSCTVSFWVKSSLTGSFAAFLYTNGGTASAPRTIVSPFTISVANTWEFKTVTFVGDVTGSGYASIGDNGAGLLFGIDLGSGTGRSTATTNTWQAVDDVRTSTTPGIAPTSGATMNLTGVQLEAGNIATPFERIDYGRKLLMCQRYYFSKYFSIFIATPAATSVAMLNYPVYMRAAPTTIGVAGFTSNVSYFTLDGQGTTNTRVVMGSTTGGAGEWTGFISAESEM